MAKKIKFEQALKELTDIVTDFENGDIDLDESIKKFERGNELLKLCEEKLDQAENKIKELLENNKTEDLSGDE